MDCVKFRLKWSVRVPRLIWTTFSIIFTWKYAYSTPLKNIVYFTDPPKMAHNILVQCNSSITVALTRTSLLRVGFSTWSTFQEWRVYFIIWHRKKVMTCITWCYYVQNWECPDLVQKWKTVVIFLVLKILKQFFGTSHIISWTVT